MSGHWENKAYMFFSSTGFAYGQTAGLIPPYSKSQTGW